MERAQKQRRSFIILGIASCVAAVVTTLLVALLWLKARYVVMGIMLFLSVVSIYSILFSFFAAHEVNIAVLVISAYDENSDFSEAERIEKTAEQIGWKKEATEKFLRKCKKRRYI